MIRTPIGFSWSARTEFTPAETVFSASTSRPESVSSSTASEGCWVGTGRGGLLERELEDLHALLLTAGEAVVDVAVGELLGDVRQPHRGLDRLAEVLQRDGALAAPLAVRVHDR